MTNSLMNIAASKQNKAINQANRMPLSYCDLDDFEEGLLPVLRHFMMSLAEPECQSWSLAYKISVERFGEALGLSTAYALFKLVALITKVRRQPFECSDPLAVDEREFVTRDEQALLQMLHHMRRDATPQARKAVAGVTGGAMDPGVIHAGLSFASRFPAGGMGHSNAHRKPRLRVVD